MSKAAPIVARGLAVLAAICLVGAFALAIFYPPFTSLQRMLGRLDQTLVHNATEWTREHWGEGAVITLLVPVLTRPAWLLPLFTGIVLIGLALTVRSRKPVQDTPRWRN